MMLRKIVNLFRNQVFLEILPLLVISFIPLLWIRDGYLILGHDVGFPVNILNWFGDKFFVWSNHINSFGGDYSLFLGTVTVHFWEALLAACGFSIFVVQKLTYIFWFFAPMVAMYYFLYTLFADLEHRYFRIWGSIFYFFNFFIITRVMVFERTGFSLMVLLPLTLALIIRYLEYRNSLIKTVILAGFLFLFFNAGGIAPLVGIFFIIVILFSVFYLLFYLPFSKKNIGRWLRLIVCLAVIFVLINAYWLLPFIYYNLGLYQQVVVNADAGWQSVIGVAEGASLSASFLNLFKLQGLNEWHLYAAPHWSDFYSKGNIGLVLAGILPLLILAPLLFFRSFDRKGKFFILFFSFLWLFFMPLASGVHAPFGNIYIWLMKHCPFFPIYRTAPYKFSYGLVFASAVLSGFAVYYLTKALSRIGLIKRWLGFRAGDIFGILAVVALLAFNFLYFTPKIFKLWENFNLRLRLPDYIEKASVFMNNKPESDRILILPSLIDNYGGVDVYNWNYWGVGVFPITVFPQGIVSDINTGSPEAVAVTSLYENILAANWVAAYESLSDFNIKYFLLRKDVAYQWNNKTKDPAEWERFLEQNLYLFSSVNTFGQWKIYELKQSPSLVEVAKIDDEIWPEIKIKKATHSNLYLEVRQASGPFTLQLKKSFDPNWRIYLPKASVGLWPNYLPEVNHFKYKNLFNAWKIQPPQSNFDLVIEYRPQRVFYLGLIISGVSLTLCLLGLVYVVIKNNRKVGKDFSQNN